MKNGDVIRGYRIVGEPTNSGGGMCVWAFATKNGHDYFVKQFLDPKWPTAESPGSAASKAVRRADCHEFEERHQGMISAFERAVAGGGNLVTAVDFFREGTFYYKVTERVDASAMDSLETLNPRQRAVVLRTLALSVQLLHRNRLVHGDLKPPNILLQHKPESNLYAAKLIDFDDAYVEGKPPPFDQIVGDLTYAAPEWFGYVKEDPAVSAADLTTAADIFSLGLVIHSYLAGGLPEFDVARFGYPGGAVGAGEPLVWAASIHPRIAELLARMTALEAADRPEIAELLQFLQDESVFGTAPPAEAPRGGRIKINMDPPADRPVPPRAPGKSRIRFNFPSD